MSVSSVPVACRRHKAHIQGIRQFACIFPHNREVSEISPNDKAKGIFFIWSADFQIYFKLLSVSSGPGCRFLHTGGLLSMPSMICPKGGIILANSSSQSLRQKTRVEIGHFDGVYNFSTPHLTNEFALLGHAMPPRIMVCPKCEPRNGGHSHRL